MQYSVHGDPNAQRKVRFDIQVGVSSANTLYTTAQILLVMGIMTPKDEFELLVPHLLSDSDTQVKTHTHTHMTPMQRLTHSACRSCRW